MSFSAGGRRGNLSLAQILQFATGVDEEPLLGFTIHPSLIFVEAENGNFLPTANTCINSLKLPRASLSNPIVDVNVLYNLYDFAFVNSYFGLM